MSRRPPAAPTCTVLLPTVLDDVAVDALRDQLFALAHDPSRRHLRLDARQLRVISARGLGLLAAVHLVTTERGGTVTAAGCTTRVKRRLAAVRIAGELDVSESTTQGAHDRDVEQDWTPWWTSAAANA